MEKAMFDTTRRNLGAGLLGALALPSMVPASAASAKSYELTFLKSASGDTGSLAQFISQNWFVMDRIALEKGLLTDYRMLIAADKDQPWDVLVIVGYPSVEGYSGIAAAFEKIRAAHKIIPVSGKTLRELGAITGSRRLLPA
jgi:hypothetical protein